MAGRTLYWPKDAAWWRRGRIVKLGREFGPAGPAVIDHLMCDARTQGPIKGHDGSVKSDYSSLALLCFINDDDLVAKIVERAVALGVLDDFEEDANGTFECRMSGWNQDVERPLNSERQARKRTPKQPDVPQSTPEYPNVTREVEVDGEVEITPPVVPLTGDEPAMTDLVGSVIPRKPGGGRQRDKDEYARQLAAWVAAHSETLRDPHTGRAMDETTLLFVVEHVLGRSPENPPATANNIATGFAMWNRKALADELDAERVAA